ALAASGGACFSGFYYCPHHPQGAVEAYSTRCRCRKPAPGMLFDAAEELHLDLERSWLVGDILNDVEAGSRAGCRTVLVDCGNETEWIPGPGRRPDYIASDILEAAQFIARSDGYIR
ncbi:MAG: HAD-IIIA family hydrolase, partial [Myxococcota bacterium]